MICHDQIQSRDMTINEVLTDPLILQMMQADRISIARMEDLLQDAARKQQMVRRPRIFSLAAALRSGCRGSA